MGIYDRDYMKHDHPSRRRSMRRPRGCLILVMLGGLIIGAAFWFQPDPSKWPVFIRAPMERFVEPRKNERIVVDVNTATLWELQCIPSIYESLAKSNIKGRPYSNFEQLDKVSGIGPKTMELLRKHVTIATNVEAVKRP